MYKMSKTIFELPEAKEFSKSPYDLDFIRKRLSGVFQYKTDLHHSQIAILELILCLSNEIADLKNENSKHKSSIINDDDRLSRLKLMQIHPNLTLAEADSLLEFAKTLTITHQSCYGDGSIVYPKWRELNER